MLDTNYLLRWSLEAVPAQKKATNTLSASHTKNRPMGGFILSIIPTLASDWLDLNLLDSVLLNNLRYTYNQYTMLEGSLCLVGNR